MNNNPVSISKVSIILILGLCVSCAHSPADKTAAFSSTDAVGEAADPRSNVMRAADALILGEASLKSGKADDLIRATQILTVIGARPADAKADDLVKQWSEIALLQNPELAAPVYRGRILGPAYKSGTVLGSSSLVVEQLFLAGKKATVALVPSQQSKLTIHVSNSEGAPVCVKPGVKKKASCQWLPIFTDRFEIRIQNNSQSNVKYHLVLN